MHYSPEFAIVAIACFTLAAGAATRVLSLHTRLPYTAGMLLLGVVTGVLLKHLDGGGGEHGFIHILSEATTVSPHLIIFVLLPALVFESAFALDTHAFFRNLGGVALLAGPALAASTLLTALLMVAGTSLGWGWSLPAALVFGALISATDPVAVVAILRELGAPKRLSLLIEGESMLNDGTSIVLFTVLLTLLTGAGAGLSIGGAALQFLWIVAGGTAVGLILAAAVSQWVARTFDDPLVEITLTIVLAYTAMLVAEGVLHVSGVMAVVSAGLWMSGPGKTRISPEVSHFLHQFWGMLSHIANTLIFYLVGLIIATQVHRAGAADFLYILLAFAAVSVVRPAVTFAFLPLLNRVGERVSLGETTVISWSGLRGAVSLALGLVIYEHPDVDPILRGQILLVTAGVVLLTILVNGSTTGWVLRHFGFDRLPLPEQASQLAAHASVLKETRGEIQRISRERDLRMVSWTEVLQDLEARQGEMQDRITETRAALQAAGETQAAAGYWGQALAVERQAYWSAFAEGTLSARAVRVLDHEIDLQLDRLGRGDCTPPAARTPAPSGIGAWLARRLGHTHARSTGLHFERLSLLHDLSRAESYAAPSVLASLDKLEGVDPGVLLALRKTYKGYFRAAKERLEDLRTNLPEVSRAIETRLARRVQLNLEREGYEGLVERGVLDDSAVAAALASVEERMKRLAFAETRVALPGLDDLCRATPLFSALDPGTIEALARLAQERVLAPGELLFREGDKGQSLFIIARGAVHVIRSFQGQEMLLDVLGGGDILGEVALLTGSPRTATVRAATAVTLGEIDREGFHRLMEAQPDLCERVWEAFARHQFDNCVRDLPHFRHLGHSQRLRWIGDRPHRMLGSGETIPPEDAAFAFVVAGSVLAGGRHQAPALVDLRRAGPLAAEDPARVALLPSPEDALAATPS